MGKFFEAISDGQATWLARQPLFFVATAPLAGDGHVNCSPKGQDSFRVLGPNRVAYLDLTGSGAETIAHLRENGRVTLMFCAFDGPPKIIRLFGTGTPVFPGDDGFEALRAHFGEHVGVRAVMDITVHKVGDSCGYAVPLMDLVGERDVLTTWAEGKGPDGVVAYQQERNATSIDGLPAVPPRA